MKELQEQFLQFLVQKSGAKSKKELEDYVKSLGEDGLQKAYEEFAQVMQKQAKKAQHGTKLQYFRFLKNRCADDEELYYYKKGGSLGCGCKKKMEEGGQTPKKSPVDKFKEIRKAQSGTKNYTKDQLEGREPVKVVNGVKYFLNGDGQVVKDPKGRGSAKPGDKNWKTIEQTYDEKTGKMRPATPAEIEQRKRNRKDASQGKGEGTPPNINKGIGRNKKGGNIEKDCGGSAVIAKFKAAKCGAKMKKHEQGGSLKRIPFMQQGTPKKGINITVITPEEIEKANEQNKANAKGLFNGIISGQVSPTIPNIGRMISSAYNGWINPKTPYQTGIAPTGTIKRFPSFSQMPEKFKKLELERISTEQLKKFENASLNKPKYKIWRGEKNVEVQELILPDGKRILVTEK